MAKEDDTLEKDANNFRYYLKKRIYSGDADGEKIKNYLDLVVPDWKHMTPTRLYKHIQKMFENSEQIRRFEIELIWKRAIYFIPFFVISFTAFGFGLFYFQEGNDKPISFLCLSLEGYIVLLALSFINLVLSIFISKLNVEGQEWQKNWEYHVDYLQAILGLNLMRFCIRPQTKILTIGKINTSIGIVMVSVWLILFGVLLVFISLDIMSMYDSIFVTAFFVVVVFCFSAFVIYFFIFYFFYFLASNKDFLKTRDVHNNEKSYFRKLEEF